MSTAESARILLAHGGGGSLSDALIRHRILPKFAGAGPVELADAARVNLSSLEICFTTDSYVVKPIFFPGGDIGKLAVCGTVNDLAVCGARPVALSLGLIIEEGFEIALLEKVLESAAQAARQAGVSIVTGDTKVVERGSADQIFINTSGIGIRIPGAEPGFGRIMRDDVILLSGTIGDHGMTVVSQRHDIGFQSSLQSDCAAISSLAIKLFESVPGIRFMRDPTRGGLAATLNEIAAAVQLGIEIREEQIPVEPAVRAAADILGFDVLEIANEGKFVAVVSPEAAEAALALCRSHPLGAKASIIGKINGKSDGPLVELVTAIGGRRIVQMPYGRNLPRIC
jgi:hydrogenase expression/formation protein HypE